MAYSLQSSGTKVETLTLSEADKTALANVLAPFSAKPWKQDQIDVYAALALHNSAPFVTIRSWLNKHLSKKPIALLIRNLPIHLPETGYQKTGSESEAVLVSIASMVGHVLTYTHHRGGQLVQNLHPLPEDAHTQLGTGSVYLEYHTEDAHLPYNCDFIGLLCMRGDPCASTLASEIQPEFLDNEDLAVLTRKEFMISGDRTFEKRKAHYFPVIENRSSGWKVRFDPVNTHTENKQAIRVLTKLQKKIEESGVEITLKTGDFLLLNNEVGVHARTQFDPRFDGKDRWLQRCTIFKEIPLSLQSAEYKRLLHLPINES